MAVSFVRAMLLYVLVISSIRLMGKRQIGELQPSELVITILVSNIASLPLENPDLPLMFGIVPILVLVCFEVLLSWLSLKHRKLRQILSGSPKIIIRDGKIDRAVLRELRISLDDLMTAMRTNNIFDLSEVQFAIVETTGSISVYQKPDARSVTNGDLKSKPAKGNPPDLIITDGVLLKAGLSAAGLDEAWLNKYLDRHGITRSDVFLLTARGRDDVFLIKKEAAHG